MHMGLGKYILDLLYSYLKNRKERVNINTIISNCIDLISGIPLESVLGFLFLIFFKVDFPFFYKTNICNFTNGTTHFVCHETLECVLDKLEGNSGLATFCFENNYIKLNTDKCNLLVS